MQLTAMARTRPIETPLPEVAMVIEPDAFVTVIPVPAVNVVLVKVLPVVLPINNWPSV
jgi:hypothetical protein